MTPLLFFASLVAVAPPIVIQSARIEVGNGQVIPVGNIVIQDDKIVAVGPDVQVPVGATVINGAGLTVYPGFIDAYSTSGLKLPTPLASGTKQPDTRNTAPATMWKENRRGNRADVKAVMHLDLKAPYGDRHENGVTSLLLSSGDGTISGMAGIVNLGAEPKVLSGEVATEINFRSSGGFRGGDEMAGGQGRQQTPAADPGYTYPQTPFGVFALLRQTLYDAKTYAAKTPSKADPSYEGLKPLVTGKVPALYTIANSRDIARAARYAEEFGYKFIVNGGIDTYRMIPTLKKHSVPVVINLDFTDEPTRKVGEGRDATPAAVLEDRWKTWNERNANAKLLSQAGIPIAFRGGLGMKGYLGGVRKAISYGVPREVALRSMTLGAAEIFGIGDKVGSIEPGKLANLVLMNGDFAVENKTVVSVIVEGKQIAVGAKPAK